MVDHGVEGVSGISVGAREETTRFLLPITKYEGHLYHALGVSRYDCIHKTWNNVGRIQKLPIKSMHETIIHFTGFLTCNR